MWRWRVIDLCQVREAASCSLRGDPGERSAGSRRRNPAVGATTERWSGPWRGPVGTAEQCTGEEHAFGREQRRRGGGRPLRGAAAHSLAAMDGAHGGRPEEGVGRERRVRSLRRAKIRLWVGSGRRRP